jgi:predicted nucleic-acid-binding Zn-ribbon protein
MKNGTCPRCGGNEILTGLTMYGGNGNPPFVQVAEPRPPKASLMWMPKLIQSEFTADICTACGYTEFNAVKYKEMSEGLRKGYQNG